MAYNHDNQFVIISEHLKVLQSGLTNSCLLKLSQYQSVTVLLSGNPNSNCISLMTRGGRKSQVRQCLGFVQLIHRPTRTKIQLYKNSIIA